MTEAAIVPAWRWVSLDEFCGLVRSRQPFGYLEAPC